MAAHSAGKHELQSVTPPKREKCWKTKKVRWPDQAEAERQLEMIKMLGPCWHKEQRVYLCRHCGGWHLTSQQDKNNGNNGKPENGSLGG